MFLQTTGRRTGRERSVLRKHRKFSNDAIGETKKKGLPNRGLSFCICCQLNDVYGSRLCNENKNNNQELNGRRSFFKPRKILPVAVIIRWMAAHACIR